MTTLSLLRWILTLLVLLSRLFLPDSLFFFPCTSRRHRFTSRIPIFLDRIETGQAPRSDSNGTSERGDDTFGLLALFLHCFTSHCTANRDGTRTQYQPKRSPQFLLLVALRYCSAGFHTPPPFSRLRRNFLSPERTEHSSRRMPIPAGAENALFREHRNDALYQIHRKRNRRNWPNSTEQR